MVALYLDTADMLMLHKYALDPRILGITTNPALMRKSGIKSYRNFAIMALGHAHGRPISLEVLADDWYEMEKQAREVASWGDNVWVKIPITNTRGESCAPLVKKLGNLRLNITAIMTQQQIDDLKPVIASHHIVSIFAGRIADTGRDPVYTVKHARKLGAKVLWASTREVLNIAQAEECGCDIITLTPDLIDKLSLHGKSLGEYSRETVTMFHRDGEGIAF